MKRKSGTTAKRVQLLIAVFGVTLAVGCGSGELKPVEIFPEDNCAQCRMAISDERFASEIITSDGEVFKFDDVGCFLTYRATKPPATSGAMFMKLFDTKKWIPYEQSVIVEADVATPMGTGKIVFSDAATAREFQKQHPPKHHQANDGNGCCAEKN